ncbi:hypothetical protein SASPL_112336 [Salvia splendens]|uniref:Ionotropic glutamate receptor C-terminal domain-containing protein n=1 Tax=Salvia splendens TaxID=180675 RepID=A0A8X9A368_SALSN|nr:hypothetical protein SASPL_112336 [Salvia splendens]
MLKLIRMKKQEAEVDDIISKLDEEELDALVGDVTVTANRSEHVDFTFPYSESGVVIVVPINPKGRRSAWIFMKPLTYCLGLTIGAFFVYTGFGINKAFRCPPKQQVGMIFWFSFSTLVFAQGESEEQLDKICGDRVGVRGAGFDVKLHSKLDIHAYKFLTNNDILESVSLKSYSTVDQFHEALSKGSRKGGVGAIIDELPYIRLLLSKHCDKYTMISPIYPTSGFGFGWTLVLDVSQEILRLKEDKDLVRITKKWLGDEKDCPIGNGALSSSQRLSLDSFRGLFVIAGMSSTLALVVFLSRFLYENRCLLESTASIKEKLLKLATVFTWEKDESLSLGKPDS